MSPSLTPITRPAVAILAACSVAWLASPAAALASSKKKPAKPAAEAAAPAVEHSQVLRETPLRREPFADAEALSTLAAATPVQVLQRQGAWVQVQAGEQQGWLRLLSLRSAAPAAAGGGSGLQQALNVARTGASGNTVATGVRGLSKEDITQAQPNVAELEKLHRAAVDEVQARAYAADAALVSATVPFLTPGDE